jgi:hypothetical protein
MLIFTAGGPRSIDPADVIAIYCGGGESRYTHCTLVFRCRHGGVRRNQQ